MDDIATWDYLLEKSGQKLIVMEDGQQKVKDCETICGRPVLGKILVLPKRAFEEFSTNKTWACISISDTFTFDAGMFPVITEVNRSYMIRLGFDDISRPKPGLTEMDIEQAKSIWDFVDQIWNEVDLLVIHCNAGMCRSPAVARAIAEKYYPETAELYNQLYHPNKLVYRLMKETING